MQDLFKYLKTDEDLALIKSCVFHYEMEFIHPFLDGNGRMGRLWQTLILMNDYPFFEYLPFESLISRNQEDYYKALSDSDSTGESTPFIAYMLDVIDQSLSEIPEVRRPGMSDLDRLNYFAELNPEQFTRKDYQQQFKSISAATASRDLKKGVEIGLFIKTGDKNKSRYRLKKKIPAGAKLTH